MTMKSNWNYSIDFLSRWDQDRATMRTTVFTPLPYLQVRVDKSMYQHEEKPWSCEILAYAPIKVCVVWLFWSVRLSMGKRYRDQVLDHYDEKGAEMMFPLLVRNAGVKKVMEMELHTAQITDAFIGMAPYLTYDKP